MNRVVRGFSKPLVSRDWEWGWWVYVICVSLVVPTFHLCECTDICPCLVFSFFFFIWNGSYMMNNLCMYGVSHIFLTICNDVCAYHVLHSDYFLWWYGVSWWWWRHEEEVTWGMASTLENKKLEKIIILFPSFIF